MVCVGMISHSRGRGGVEAEVEAGGKGNVSRKIELFGLI